ncbi:hypothetical protein NQ314_000628 [Rhamnusium bicolor]|uniref:C2H2-type domain-containing protein n=1 Tax=Rhamnusium bicolor TaxID=1586634 RepID=A0AAV8ZUH0_9CUCU|nr:hypothetical protein NQ314_000628 [Rhamnusium bicolor]
MEMVDWRSIIVSVQIWQIKQEKEGKKPLQTTLGKASCQNEREVDLSHVRKPIHTSIFGLKQVLSLFQTATEEVQNYITYECDIMYECRSCKTIFRSLANFILHKRNYCRERFNQLEFLNNNENIQENTCLASTAEANLMQPRSNTPERRPSTNAEVTKSLSPIIEKLKEKQEIHQLAQNILNQDLSREVESNNSDANEAKSNDLLLEEIATNNAAVFQTVLDNLPINAPRKPEYMKSEVMEIHGILDSDEAVLGPDGKICTFETNKVNENPIIPKSDLICTECSLRFSTKKTLTYHVKYKHNKTRLVYVCPDCKHTFANAWCVYRHLYKIHRRTSAQIKRMREQVHNSCIRRDQEPAKKREKKQQEKIDKTDEENQWLNNIEGDNDFQMCGGCGKRFERKAALHSHAQMCIKRIAVCNTIKENYAKKKEEECKDNKNKNSKSEKVGSSEVLKGSSKRKPYLLRTYKPNERITMEEQKIEPDDEDKDICDVNSNCEILKTNCDNEKNIVKEEEKESLIPETSCMEDQLSPSKGKDHCDSPIEKIDTEKMLSIIGITSNYESLIPKESEGTSDSNSQEDLVTKEELMKNRCHTATDFDLFCQNISDNSVTDMPEKRENCQKLYKTVPLILRRRNSSKSEKKSFILDHHREVPVTNEKLDENKVIHFNKEDVLEYENIAQVNENDSNELESMPSTSTFRISVKSLEDLIGVSTEDHIKNSENKEIAISDEDQMSIDVSTEDNKKNSKDKEIVISDEDQTKNEEVERYTHANFPLLMFDEISDTIRANVSPEKLQTRLQKSLKRKRTSSFNYTRSNKSIRLSDNELFSNKEDVSFIGRASSYMDQNKLLCIPCQTTYPTLTKLLWHMSAHFSWFRFQCSRCCFISFNKLDCANHARKNHNVKKSSIPSVVLPIPNWKTVLMAHDFSMLKDDNDLSGKHTDEVLSGSQDEPIVIEDVEEQEKDDEDITDWYNNLFVDSKPLHLEPENDLDIPLNNDNSIKQENIDVVDDSQESFQIEVPQEIYTFDMSEIIKGVDHEERFRLGTHVKIEKIEQDEIEESYYTPEQKENNEPIADKVKIEIPSEDETNEKLFDNGNEEVSTEPEDNFKKVPGCIVNTRPTRNRTRSVKTLQNDFFYDLSKVIKLNDSSLSKTNVQRHKKTSNGTSQRNGKESVSASIKNETKQLRVYSKKK